jgi:hypothetical protein
MRGEPIRIGCSGWQYRHWRKTFYPLGLPQRLWLEHYATQFETVEVNNFAEQPRAQEGDLLHHELDDGRVVNCQLLCSSTYCAGVGEGPIQERRQEIRTSLSPSSQKPR